MKTKKFKDMLKVQFYLFHGPSVADRCYRNQNAESFIKYLFSQCNLVYKLQFKNNN